IKEHHFKADIDAIIKASNRHTKLIFIANPNNPTGSWLTRDETLRLIHSIAPHTLLVIDEAYGEYAFDDPDIIGYQSALELVDQYPNLCVLRTFSKIHGLAGLRVGWGYASRDIINTLNRARSPFNLSTVAGWVASHAVSDDEHVEKSRLTNRTQQKRLQNGLQTLGIDSLQSAGNFILADFKTPERADLCVKKLLTQNIFIRSMRAYDLAQYVRISCGVEQQQKTLLQTLKNLL
ncbi:MAG: histidinol-phosphate transaminase, partial [Pseudomonadota bacterium]